VGHAGTLDPFASGVLVLLLGSATRLSEYFMGMDKTYQATVRLGVETETHDPEGKITAENPAWEELNEQELRHALRGFRGRIEQTPPAYSAKKVRGEAAHRRTRRGEEVELTPVPVDIHELDLLGVELPEMRVTLRCSSGTYVRALARDLGRFLGVGGHLTALRRTRVGPFDLASSLPLDRLGALEDLAAALLPPAQALSHLPAIRVEAADALRIRQGQFLALAEEDLPEDTPIRVLLREELLAIASREGNQLRPRKVLIHG
jgi:tRNA pseudouridine55 synthase